MHIDVELMKSERDRLREGLRELETEARRLEADVKAVRQREIQTKREIEALNTLLEIHDGKDPKDPRAPDLT